MVFDETSRDAWNPGSICFDESCTGELRERSISHRKPSPVSSLRLARGFFKKATDWGWRCLAAMGQHTAESFEISESSQIRLLGDVLISWSRKSMLPTIRYASARHPGKFRGRYCRVLNRCNHFYFEGAPSLPTRPLTLKLHNNLQVHKLCQASAEKILNDFKPNLMIAIGGGGYVPARILRLAILSHALGFLLLICLITGRS